MYERLLKLIQENMPSAHLENVSMDSRLIEDLGMDSVGMMMLSMSMEDEFGLSFDEPVFFEKVKDVIEFLEKNATK